MTMTRRRTSRVLLLDDRDRLLLLCGRDPRRPGARWWFTVGGGVEDGESHPAAAVREILEETALALPVARLGPLVWTRTTVFHVDGHGFDQHEEYRVARVTADERTRMEIDPAEARYGHHWWSVPELATTTETVRPHRMADLLPALFTPVPPGRAPLHLGHVDEGAETGPREPEGGGPGPGPVRVC
ncbi:NUDIX hydrolase [Streptomyces sp. NPDC057694]|uniref:NUDIX hydrolase n=1 Tax=Streptomyces sp. NPDC057694 TaxID=3346216 RepID=UPI00368D9B4B